MLIIGETLNASIKTVAEAIIARDDNLVAHLAKEQVKAGANMLDVNAGIGMRDEYADLLWLGESAPQTLVRHRRLPDWGSKQATYISAWACSIELRRIAT